jgi:hypothetical protein
LIEHHAFCERKDVGPTGEKGKLRSQSSIPKVTERSGQSKAEKHKAARSPRVPPPPIRRITFNNNFFSQFCCLFLRFIYEYLAYKIS